jgi:hypothetical protein
VPFPPPKYLKGLIASKKDIIKKEKEKLKELIETLKKSKKLTAFL